MKVAVLLNVVDHTRHAATAVCLSFSCNVRHSITQLNPRVKFKS